MTTESFDLIVIGAGSAAREAAAEGRQRSTAPASP